MPESRPLRVFLCHASQDKPKVRELYRHLKSEGWIDPWLDEEKLLPGHDWHMEIERAAEVTDTVVVFLSNNSVAKEGYVQRELKYVLDIADEKPEGTIFVIPLRLDDCPAPRRLRGWQYVDYFPDDRKDWAYERIVTSLKIRAEALGIKAVKQGSVPVPRTLKPSVSPPIKKKIEPTPRLKSSVPPQMRKENKPALSVETIATAVKIKKSEVSHQTWGGIEFMRVPAGEFLMGSKGSKSRPSYYDLDNRQHTVEIPVDYWVARFLVTNEQYVAFVKAKGINRPVSGWTKKRDHPVVRISWEDAMVYCSWLNNLLKSELPRGHTLRLPTEAEWEKAARGNYGSEWPWGNEFDKEKCNSSEGGKDNTTSIGLYSPHGDSPYGCADMAGNVNEWTHSLYRPYPYQADDGREDELASDQRVHRGGAYYGVRHAVRCANRVHSPPYNRGAIIGFRVAVSPISYK